MKLFTLALFMTALAVVPACSSTKYGDPEATETVNADWGSTDLQQFSKKMVGSLVNSPQLAYLDGPAKRDDKRIIMYMGRLENATNQHIDTQAVTDAMRTELLQSGRFRFVADPAGQDQIGEQVRFQNDGRVNPEMAKQFGKQLGADMILYGRLTSIDKKKGRSFETLGVKMRDVYYQFVFNAVNIETGEIIWSEKDEIRKAEKTGLFGG